MPEPTGKKAGIDFDENGHLLDFDQWSEAIAQRIANAEGIGDLTEEHFQILYAIRRYYEKFNIAPMVHILSRETGKNYKELYSLFKKQPGKRAVKLAGLPKATGCV